MHEYVTRSLHGRFNQRKDIVYRRSSSILISVIRISYRKITLYECPFNIQRHLGLGVAYMTMTCEGLGFFAFRAAYFGSITLRKLHFHLHVDAPVVLRQ